MEFAKVLPSKFLIVEAHAPNPYLQDGYRHFELLQTCEVQGEVQGEVFLLSRSFLIIRQLIVLPIRQSFFPPNACSDLAIRQSLPPPKFSTIQ